MMLYGVVMEVCDFGMVVIELMEIVLLVVLRCGWWLVECDDVFVWLLGLVWWCCNGEVCLSRVLFCEDGMDVGGLVLIVGVGGFFDVVKWMYV